MRLTNSHVWLTWYLQSGQWLHQRYCSMSTKFYQGSRTGKINGPYSVNSIKLFLNILGSRFEEENWPQMLDYLLRMVQSHTGMKSLIQVPDVSGLPSMMNLLVSSPT